MALTPGTKLGSYEIIAPLGAGGMGEVYRARDTHLGRSVAIKILPAAFSADSDRLRRFEEEARSASTLNHPNIITIHHLGHDGSTHYIAMELVEGKTLRDLLASGLLPMRKAIEIAAQVAEGLTKAHEAGIPHRDLKPENLMVSHDGFVKILDFGLAKHGSPSGERSDMFGTSMSLTASGLVLGTRGYMSPEQAGGRPLDFRSDQFSFGLVLYEMVTGKRAFRRSTASGVPSTMPKPTRESAAAVPAPVLVTFCLGLWRLVRKSPVRWWPRLWAYQPNALRSRSRETWIFEAPLAYQKTCPSALRAFIFILTLLLLRQPRSNCADCKRKQNSIAW